MASLRCISVSKHIPRTISSSRLLTTTGALRTEATYNVKAVQSQKKPIGGFRGGIIGFLFGFSLAASFAAYHLLEEYQQASSELQASIEELKVNTEKVSAHIKRIESVEKDLKALNSASASKEDISRIRTEVKKLYDGLHIG